MSHADQCAQGLQRLKLSLQLNAYRSPNSTGAATKAKTNKPLNKQKAMRDSLES